jgi:ribosomal protein L30E
MKDIYELRNVLWFGSGGGSQGGGGSSGVVDYPAYMKTWHGLALDNAGGDTLSQSVTDAMNTAFGSSPFVSEAAYNPDMPIAEILSAANDLEALVNLLSAGTPLDDLVSDVLSPARITDTVNAYEADLSARVNATNIPRFEAGMRDIGAVVNSAFVIGRALIEDQVVREVGKFSADLTNQVYSDSAIKMIQLKLQYQYQLSALAIEANRMKIVAKKEENDTNIKLEESDALWDLEVFKYGGNLLGAIAGTAVSTGDNRWDSRPAGGSVIGGALSGAAAGAMAGNSMVPGGTGAVVGGGIGGLLGIAGAFFK